MKRAATSLGDLWTTITLADMTQEEFDIVSELASVKRVIHSSHESARYHVVVDGFVHFTPYQGSNQSVHPISECTFVFSREGE
jgi:hypothetical protein